MRKYDADQVNEALKELAFPYGSMPGQGGVMLADIFRFYDKEIITELAKRHGLSGYSKLKKDDLIRKTTEHMLSPEVMSRYFLCARDAEIRLFEQVLQGERRIPYYEQENMDYLYAGGYVTMEMSSELYTVADDVKQAYEAVNTEAFHAARSRISCIGDYLCAANALYAVTPVSLVLEIFNKYEAKKLTEDELKEAYERLHAERPEVELIEGRFVDCVLAEQKKYDELYSTQQNVPYYIPDLREIKWMADNGGFLMSKELQKFGEFLTDVLGVGGERIPYILRDVQYAISVGSDLQTVVDELETHGVIFRGQEELEKFTSQIMDVWNSTRMVLNRGYTPYEMVTKGFSRAAESRRNVQKIYPNDLCPCGSGKKYKKCCGKKV